MNRNGREILQMAKRVVKHVCNNVRIEYGSKREVLLHTASVRFECDGYKTPTAYDGHAQKNTGY